MPSTSFPNPLGDGGTAGNPSSIAVLAMDVMPVRLVFNQPIPVKVINWPGKPPPLPSMLKPPSFVPPLPKPPAMPTAAKPDPLLMSDVVKGLALGGILLAGIQQVKATFVDPLLGAAKGGLDSGISRGMHSGTLAKSFEVLGVTIGSVALPAIIQLSAYAVALADKFERVRSSMPYEPKEGFANRATDFALGNFAPLPLQIPRWLGLANPGSFARRRILGFSDQEGIDVDRRAKQVLPDIIQSLRESIGAKGGFVGVADIREQAQMAAFEDPLEARIKAKLDKALDEMLNGTAEDKIFVKMLDVIKGEWNR